MNGLLWADAMLREREGHQRIGPAAVQEIMSIHKFKTFRYVLITEA
jgi:hypothetical protein